MELLTQSKSTQFVEHLDELFDSLLNLTIAWVKNPPAQTIVTTSITMNSYTADGYKVDEGTTATIDNLFSALEIAPITNIVLDPEDPSAGATTNYDIIFTADTDIPVDSYVLITILTEVVISATNAGGATVLDTCSDLFTTTTTLVCTIGTDTAGLSTVKVTGIFPAAVNTGQFGVKLGLFDNPAAAGNTGSFKIEIFTPADKPIAGKDIDTPVVIEDPVTTCDSNCLTCSGTATS